MQGAIPRLLGRIPKHPVLPVVRPGTDFCSIPGGNARVLVHPDVASFRHRSRHKFSQMPLKAVASSSGPLSPTDCQSEKFKWARARFTSPCNTKDTIGAREYHGQTVSFEWQSPQDLRSSRAAGGGTDVCSNRLLRKAR